MRMGSEFGMVGLGWEGKVEGWDMDKERSGVEWKT